MIYRTYGTTGLRVSAIGFGGMRFKDQSDEQACAALVKACYEGGINYFDTAAGYGRSEELMGLAFREMTKTRRERPFYVATKTFAATEADVRRDAERSLKRLQIDAIDFYHMWCLMNPQAYQDRKAKGALKGFEKLKEEGLVKHIVVSSHMNGREIGAVLRDYPFAGVLLGYSAANFAYREAALTAAAELGRAVVVMNPLAGGIIPQHPERFGFVRTQPDETVVEGALRFLLNDPRITVALVGMSSQDHLREALRAVAGFQPLSAEAVTHIRSSLRDAYSELCTGCAYCDECPQSLPLPKLMDAYNQYLLSGKTQDMINRMAWHWSILKENNHLDRCVECGICLEKCTQKLPIVARLKQMRVEVETYLRTEAAKKKQSG